MNGWLIAALVLAFGLASVVALRLWGPQIVGGLVRLGVEKAWAALKADRMTPEQEAAWRDCQRRGGRWDPIKKRCTDRR